MTDHLGAAWREYRLKVMPLDAPAIQAQECRRAFYCGAHALMGIVLHAVQGNPTDEPTERDLALMDAIATELAQFERDVRAGTA